MAEHSVDPDGPDEGLEGARVDFPSHDWPLYSKVVALCVTLSIAGCYLLYSFLNSRPVDLVPLAEQNEQCLAEVLPYVGELLDEYDEQLRDEHAIWKRYSKSVRLHPEVTLQGAASLLRRGFGNSNLVVRAETKATGTEVLTVSYLGYVTHRIDVVPRPPLELGSAIEPRFEPGRPKLAIIVDDLGYPSAGIDDLFAIDAPLTVSVLPHLELTQQLAERARQHGFEVLLHLPLEGNSEAPVNEGTLETGMDEDTLRAVFEKDMASVPDVAGINSHQGSTFTADYEAMNRLMGLITGRGLFFVDSRTSAESVAERVAREHGVYTASNDMFLDNIDDEQYVETQLAKLIEIAVKRGSAIGICHVHKSATMKVLAKCQAEFELNGVQLVPVSQLVQ